VVKKGLDWLVSVQQPNGYFGVRNYENAVVTMALCEAYAMTGDPALKVPAQKGVDMILAQQNHADGKNAADDQGYGNGFGWDYQGPDLRNDSSVTGWQIMALKSALAGQLNVGNGMEGAKRWLETVWKATNKDWAKLDPYQDESRFPYTYMTDSAAVDLPPGPEWLHDLSCVGAVCAVFLGHHAGDTMLETLANYAVNHQTPTAYPCNTYYMYYNTLAVFQIGGDNWKKWNSSVRDLLVNGQRRSQDCFDGSWDFQGTMFPMEQCGRILSTAYCCLCLEVYYRYAQVATKP
jgi:hypothetical protein